MVDVDMLIGVAPWTAGVVDADGLVHFDLAAHCFCRGETDLAERDAEVEMELSGEVDLAGIREVVAAIDDRGCVGRFFRAGITDPGYSGAVFVGVHKMKKPCAGKRMAEKLAVHLRTSDSSLPSAELPASGSRGSSRTSQPCRLPHNEERIK